MRRARSQRWDVVEGIECCAVGNIHGVDFSHRDAAVASLWVVGQDRQHRIMCKRLVQVGEGSNRVGNYVGVLFRECSCLEGQVLGWKRLDIEPGDDAEIAAASFQRQPQVRVRRRVRVQDLAASEDNFVVDNIIAGEPLASRIPRDAAAEKQSADTHYALSPSRHRDTVLGQLFVDGQPARSGADACGVGRCVVRRGVQLGQVDGHSRGDVVRVVGPVPAATDGYVPVSGAIAGSVEGDQCLRDFGGGAGQNEAVGLFARIDTPGAVRDEGCVQWRRREMYGVG